MFSGSVLPSGFFTAASPSFSSQLLFYSKSLTLSCLFRIFCFGVLPISMPSMVKPHYSRHVPCPGSPAPGEGSPLEWQIWDPTLAAFVFPSKRNFGIFSVSASDQIFLSAMKAHTLCSLLIEVMSHDREEHSFWFRLPRFKPKPFLLPVAQLKLIV